MFAINYFGNQKRIINNVEDEREEMGSQSRIYDYNTGIYARILPSNDGQYGFAESGLAATGIFYELYGFEGLLDDDFDLSDYYDKETRMFEFPDGYVAWHLMAQVFGEFLIPLDLVEKISLEG